MNLEELDALPQGFGKLYNPKQGPRIRNSGVETANEINKTKYVCDWLSSVSSENEYGRLHAKPNVLVPQDVNSSASQSRSSSSSQPSLSLKLYPEGYNYHNIRNSKKKQAKTSMNNTPSRSNLSGVPDTLNNMKVSESKPRRMASHNEIDEIVSAKDMEDTGSRKSTTGANKDQTPTQTEEWNILENKHAGSDAGIANKQIKVLKKACGICVCKLCESDQVHNLDYTKEEFTNGKEQVMICRPSPLFAKEAKPVKTVMTSSVKKSKIDAISTKILVHGLTIPNPQLTINKSNLVQPIQDCLHARGFTKTKPIQSYGIQGIMRGNNVCMVSGHKTGKSFTYVAAMSSFLVDNDERYDRLPTCHAGPKLIVLTNTSAVAENAYQMFNEMLGSSRMRQRIWLPVLPLNQKDISHRFGKKSPPVDVIITTPDALIILLNDKIIDLKRLCHLVIENIDIILDKQFAQLQLLLQAVDSMLSHRSYFDSVQLITTGERWTVKLEQLIAQLDNFPLICIGNPMQAALYGRADFQLQYLESGLKAKYITEMLKKRNYNLFKCIIVCKLHEIPELEDYFSSSGIHFAIATDDMEGNHVVDIQESWMTTPNGQSIVLICTDKVLRTYIPITNVNFIINYSLPPTWSLFSARFSTLIDSYSCPLTSTFNQIKYYSQIITLVDEKCKNYFPRLADFFTANGITIPDVLEEYCKECKLEVENEKVDFKTKLCALLKTFGKCPLPKCPQRHIFSKDLDECDQEPFNGQIKGRFITAKGVNRYYIQISEYTDLNGNTHKVDDYSKAINEFLQESTGFELSPSITVGETYLYCDKKEVYRCVVENIAEYATIGDTTTNDPSKVEIFGLDNANKIVTGINNIFILPNELKQIPPSVIEIIVASVIPPSNELTWTRHLWRGLVQQLRNFDKTEITCYANIMLKLNGIMWVDDLHFTGSVGPLTKTFSLCSYLKKRHTYKTSTESLEYLYDMCQQAGIDLPTYKVQTITINKKKKQRQSVPSWAHLIKDELNELYFSAASSVDCLYVKLKNFEPLLKRLEKDIEKLLGELHRKLTPEEIKVGNYYTLVDEADGSYCRVLLHEIIDEMAKCFFVDYGDYISVPINSLLFLPDNFITRLPFQAIECSLYGIQDKSASETTIDTLYDYAFEADSDIFKTLYAKFMSEEIMQYPQMTVTKYSIILTDCSSESLNENLIKNNLAIKICEESLNIDLSQYTVEQQGSESDSVYEEDENDFGSFNDDDFDFVMSESLMDRVKSEIPEILPKSSVPETPTNSNRFVPMKAALLKTSSDKLLPKVDWYQTQTHVFLELPFVENNSYSVQIARNRFLHFKTTFRNQNYDLNMNLYNTVSKEFQHESKTHFISIKLTKEKEEEWPRLSKSAERMSNVKYKLEKIEIEEEEEEDSPNDDDIDPSVFNHIDISPEGNLYEFYSDIDSDTDYSEHGDDL